MLPMLKPNYFSVAWAQYWPQTIIWVSVGTKTADSAKMTKSQPP